MTEEFIIPGVMALMGTLAHFLKKMMESSRNKEQVRISVWFAGHWMQTMLSVVLVVASYVMLWYLGDLSPASAFLAGFTGGSGADALGSRTKAVVKNGTG